MAEEEIRQLKHLVRSAVEAAYAEPMLLVKNDGSPRVGNEQTIAFRVGVHLHELLKGTQLAQLHLDCEYNKQGDDPKNLGNSTIRPDLLIHSRGNDDQNILAVEFAGHWKAEDKVNEDRQKLSGLTSHNHTYKYQLGILVKLNKDGGAYEYFRNGTAENL